MREGGRGDGREVVEDAKGAREREERSVEDGWEGGKQAERNGLGSIREWSSDESRTRTRREELFWRLEVPM